MDNVKILGTPPPEILAMLPEIIRKITEDKGEAPERVYVGTTKELETELGIPTGGIGLGQVEEEDGVPKRVKDMGEEILYGILEKFADKILYNGVKGDSCSCTACNLRRVMNGPDKSLDEEREVTDEDKAALAKKDAREAHNAALLEGLDVDDMESDEFDKLPPPTKAAAMDAKHDLMMDAINTRYRQLKRCLKETQRNVRMLKMISQMYPGGMKDGDVKFSLMAELIKAALISRIEAAAKFMGQPEA